MRKHFCYVCENETYPFLNEKILIGATSLGNITYPYSLLMCNNCGHIQKNIEGKWFSQINNLYQHYPFIGRHINNINGKIVTRESIFIEALIRVIKLPSKGSYLDYGCGAGYMLKDFGDKFPSWELSGFDVSTNFKDDIIKKYKSDFIDITSIKSMNKKFDLITMNHVLEHLADPLIKLKQIRKNLKNNGHLIVRVPYFSAVNTDFTLLEHLSHFTHETLDVLVKAAGFNVIRQLDNVSNIEICYICEKSNKKKIAHYEIKKIEEEAIQAIEWSETVAEFIKNYKLKNKAIFGLGGSGLWLGTLLKNELSYILDEDPNKIGKTFSGIPIIHPAEAPENLITFIAFNNHENSVCLLERIKDKYALNCVVPE